VLRLIPVYPDVPSFRPLAVQFKEALSELSRFNWQ